MALDFFAGCAGGAAGVVVGHPLDTVKVRLQTQDPTNIKYRGTFHCLSTIIKQESVSGLYKGISSPLFGVAGVNAMIFGVYGALRPYVCDSPGNDALWAHFAAGSISGAVQSVVASPMELVKTRMQINEDRTSTKKSGPIDILRNIYHNEGGLLRGVFKGWSVTLSREVPGFGFYFASYEALTRLGGNQISTLGMLMAGGMAGVISWVVTFPIDVVKTKIQCDDKGKYRGVLDCVRKTWANEGHRAFTRGLMSTVIRAFPTNAATFTVVTWIMRLAGEPSDDGIDDSRKYLDQLLKESSQLQENLEKSLRLKVPHYLFNGSSLTSSCLASQCAASARKYTEKNQDYFNFYNSLYHQYDNTIQDEHESTNGDENETDEDEKATLQKQRRRNVKTSAASCENKVVSHEGAAFPIRVTKTENIEIDIGIHNSSSSDLKYLAKSLDVSAHILEIGAAVKPNTTDIIDKSFANGSNENVAMPTKKAPSRGSILNAWKKYCTYKTNALNWCKCIDDHCVCYL